MSQQLILSIDQGTTGSTVAIIDCDGRIVGMESREFPQIFPRPGWVEHDPDEIWGSVILSIESVIRRTAIDVSRVKAIGITNQRETIIGWERSTGRPVGNAIVWQDRRTTDFCQKLKKKTEGKFIIDTTGLVLDPYFSASKIRWILDGNLSARTLNRGGNLCFGTMDTFLIWRLTGGKTFRTDVSNASRTQLMSLKDLQWNAKLLKIFGIQRECLPEICRSNGYFGETKGLKCLPDGIPIHGVAGDQQAALFGQTAFSAGEVKCTFGTGSFILMNTGNKIIKSKTGMLTTVAWQLEGKKAVYALEGGAFICGAAVQWLRDGLGFVKKTEEIEALARQVEGSDGVEFVPALTGLGAPYWDPNAKGIISGLTRGTTRAHIARATLEAMALQNAEIVLAMEKDLGKKFRSMKVDGGATANRLLLQIQADYLGAKVVKPAISETTVLGAGLLAGLGVGIWKNEMELKGVWQQQEVFEPKIKRIDRVLRFKNWHKAIGRTLF